MLLQGLHALRFVRMVNDLDLRSFVFSLITSLQVLHSLHSMLCGFYVDNLYGAPLLPSVNHHCDGMARRLLTSLLSVAKAKHTETARSA